VQFIIENFISWQFYFDRRYQLVHDFGSFAQHLVVEMAIKVQGNTGFGVPEDS
jgi:hypothetical protein